MTLFDVVIAVLDVCLRAKTGTGKLLGGSGDKQILYVALSSHPDFLPKVTVVRLVEIREASEKK